MTGVYEAGSVEETWALAAKFASGLERGDVVLLEGDLGAGKTTFTQGVAHALGVSGRVASPTFCIVREHASPRGTRAEESVLLVHMDLYRLCGEEDVLAIGWEDYLARGAILMVEWPERAGSLVPPGAWRVSIKNGPDEENRIIHIDRIPPYGV